MEYLTTMRRTRNLLFAAFLINLFIVILCWGFVMLDLAQYFTWAFPNIPVWTLNVFIMWAVIIMDIAGCVLFLVPTLALTWGIVQEKRAQKWWEKHGTEYIAQIEKQVIAEMDTEKAAETAAKKFSIKKSKPKIGKTRKGRKTDRLPF